MPRLIDADALPVHRAKILHAFGIIEGNVIFPEHVANAPTIDAEPVRHGRWVQGKWATYPDGYVCDRCSTGFAIPYSYCPHCGAKMDGGADNA